MSIFLLIYLIVALFMLLLSIKVFKQYIKSCYGKYLFTSILCYFVWIIIYILSFTITDNTYILLYFSRLLYSLFLIGLYSMLCFIILFNTKNNIKIHKYIILTFIIFFMIGVFSPFIIENIEYSELQNIYVEKYGTLYFINAILYIISPLLIILFSYIKLKTVNTINKIRLKYIILGFLFFCLGEWLFLVILPLFNIWILQKEQILFFIPFILGIYYSINRYHFLNIQIGFIKILTYVVSITLSVISTFLIYKIFYHYYKMYDEKLVLLFGKQNKYLSGDDLLFYSIITIIIFIIYNKLIKNYLKYDLPGIQLINKLNKLKKEIPFITNLNDLNKYLNVEFINIFNIKYIEIILENTKGSEVEKYFNKNKLNTIFINDIVFIEENKNKFNYKKIKSEINNKSYLIFPIRDNKKKLIGTFNMGMKLFKDNYVDNEIDSIKDFVCFIEGHMKYISIYNKINKLNINLDKLVDEKTIEYNILINKQKEFISYISHEVKTPIANSIFQADCIINDIKSGESTNSNIIKDLDILNSQLLKSGSLLNKLFDIEKYDINKYKLYKENTNLNKLLIENINVFKKINKDIKFKINIYKNNIYTYIDIVQFTQVLDNLINNAIKFGKSKKPIIEISNYISGKYIYITIEDNGKGFCKNQLESIFNKYSTGENLNTGLGMGLYLCKKIIEMHNGSISAHNSDKLGGAKFEIKLEK